MPPVIVKKQRCEFTSRSAAVGCETSPVKSEQSSCTLPTHVNENMQRPIYYAYILALFEAI